MKTKKLFITLATVLVTSLTLVTPLNAHDTDIYVNSSAGAGSEPLVLFVLDYRSNLGSTVCGGGECDDLVAAGYMTAAASYTFFDLLRGVFRKVLDPLGGFKVGFMMNHDQGNNCAGPQGAGANCSNGGYVIHGLKSVTKGTDPDNTYETLGEDPNKVALFNKLDRIPVPSGNVSHSFQGKELYFELFRYLTGQGIYNAHNGYTDYGTTNAANIDELIDAMSNGTEADGDVNNAWLSYDTSIEGNINNNPSGELYKSPLAANLGGEDCSGIYVINIMFQVSNQESDSDNDIKKTKSNGGLATGEAQADIISLQGQSNSFDTVIKWMNDIDLADGTFGTASDLNGKQNVTSYFLTPQVNNTTNGYAEAGGTTRALELSSDPAELEKEISSILNQILSVSTTFVAPSVAVNVYNRSQVQNDVFIAMFQAEETGKPSWVGNTKKFKLGELDGVLGILDFNDKDAVNPIDGRVKDEALSYWTLPSGLIDPVQDIDDFLAGADGRFVDRGGCGSRIPGYKKSCSAAQGNNPPSCTDDGSPGMSNPAGTTVDIGPRKIFTEPVGGVGALRNLNADGATASQADILAAFTDASAAGTCANNEDWDTACNLIRYVRGINDDGTNRAWMMADPLHSRPLALNYGGSLTNPDIRVYFGGNDGLMHMIRNTKNDDSQDGVEGWAFMPLETMKITRSLKEDSTSTAHPYGLDGSAVSYVYDQDGDGNIEAGDKVYLYFGLRRGGRSYYALDVSDPDNPSQLWTLSNQSAGFGELGQSWSTPKIGHMLFGSSNTPKPVLIFAGGYDENKDNNSVGHSAAAGGNDSMGRAIFIVDAETGALVWRVTYGATTGPASGNYTHADMLDSIPSDVTAADTDGNGLIDRIYVGDTGGSVWRVDMLSYDQSNWTVDRIFSGGRHYDATASEDRRFFYAPDYVQARTSETDGGTAYDAIVIGSGDRVNPLDTAVNNWFYVIRDENTKTGGIPQAMLTHADADLADRTCTLDNSCGTSLITTLGWKLQLKCDWQSSGTCGEKSLATAITVSGKIYFTTYQPASGVGTACDPNEGAGWLYIVALDNGDAVEDLDLTQAGLESYTKLSSGGIPSEVVSLGEGKLLRPDLKIDTTDDTAGFRTFWFEHVFDY